MDPAAERPGRFRHVPAAGRPTAPVLGPTTTPWVLDLLRRHREAAPSVRVCEHLAADPDEPAEWRATAPGLRSCRRPACLEALRDAAAASGGPARCTTCGRTGVPLRGVGVAAGATMLRGTVCEDDLAARPVPTPPGAADLSPAPAPFVLPSPLGGDEPPVDHELRRAESAGGIPSPDAVGRRALRRGWLLARACRTATGRDATQGPRLAAALLHRAELLAEGLSGAPGVGDALAREVALRSLVTTTTTAWWLVCVDAVGTASALGELERTGSDGLHPRDVAPRLAALGREGDLRLLLGASGSAGPGSREELDALGLLSGTAGRAGPGGRSDEPRRLLVVGEHLALCAADHALRAGVAEAAEIRRLAQEVSDLRRRVASAEDAGT